MMLSILPWSSHHRGRIKDHRLIILRTQQKIKNPPETILRILVKFAPFFPEDSSEETFISKYFGVTEANNLALWMTTKNFERSQTRNSHIAYLSLISSLNSFMLVALVLQLRIFLSYKSVTSASHHRLLGFPFQASFFGLHTYVILSIYFNVCRLLAAFIIISTVHKFLHLFVWRIPPLLSSKIISCK